MRNYFKNNQGITLVELIAALALVSMVAILIMTTLGIGFKHSIAEANKTSTQQEANLIVSKLLNTHRTGDCYFIRDNSGRIEIAPVSNDLCTSPVDQSALTFNPISDSKFTVSISSPEQLVQPTRDDYTLVAEIAYEKAVYQVNTKLTRYKTTN
ncbi:type II secretion system protein [Paenisporosarcina sp. NPDC076898]|uniref:type II secretion system protein n=1 Tax=unclassified Paenisporosarcina TaxID=2642018 RepID=UPI003CFEC75B